MDKTLLDTFLRRSASHGERMALRQLSGPASSVDATLTWAEWSDRSRRLATAMRAAGVRPGDRVAILAGNTALWPISEMAALMLGAITVGIYPTSAPVQVHAIMNDAGARLLIVDTDEQLAKAAQVRSALPMLRCILAAEPTADAEHVAAWLQADALADVHAAKPDDTAILIYTSGSTGEPKGACISHRYVQASAHSIQQVLQLTEADSALSFLPYCHAAERIFGLHTRIHAGMACGLVSDPRNIWQAASTFEPTLFGGLPRFYEKLYEALHAEFEAVTEVALPAIRERLADFVGSRVRVATSGGAALPVEVLRYLASCGLEVVTAYGLTEHLCAAMHQPNGERPAASVGRAMPGTEMQISESGEILLRKSSLTFSGYYNNPSATRAAFTNDGEWLRTGDLGYIDAAGYLYITGREKDLIALSTGKKVAPLPIEADLASAPLISQAVLLGENQKFVSALIALRPTALRKWARDRGVELHGIDVNQHPDVIAAVQREIDRVNAGLSRSEQIKRFAVLPEELTVERNELTPTLKVRRKVISERYRGQLESWYGRTV